MALGKAASGSGALAVVVLNSLSAGTFVYLSCCDLIIDSFHQGEKDLEEAPAYSVWIIRMIKLFVFILGILVVILFMLLGPAHEH